MLPVLTLSVPFVHTGCSLSDDWYCRKSPLLASEAEDGHGVEGAAAQLVRRIPESGLQGCQGDAVRFLKVRVIGVWTCALEVSRS